jgi:peptide/nickel transport system substrate-binding protein
VQGRLPSAVNDKKIGVEWVPCGCGPYTITSYNPDAEIKLQAFPDYYRGKARIDKVNYKILTDNNTITVAFESGELDYIVVPTASWANLSANSNYTTYLSPTNHTSFFHINVNNNDALSNKLVRQALSYAIDRESMCIAAYDGIAQPAYSMFNPDSVFGGFTVKELEAAGIPTYQYDPDKAKALLAEAGYAGGLDIGTILTISGSYWEKMATVFQSNLADIGVTVHIELADSAACRARRKEHDYQLATTGTNYTPEASYAYQYFRYLTSEQKTGGMYTELGVEDKELDALFQKAMSETDNDQRKADYLEVNRMMQDQMYSIPTFYKSIPYAYHKDLVCDEINNNYYYVYNFSWN